MLSDRYVLARTKHMRVEAESRLIVRIGGGAADIVVKRPYAADAARFVQNVADELCLVAPEAADSAFVTLRFPPGSGDVPRLLY